MPPKTWLWDRSIRYLLLGALAPALLWAPEVVAQQEGCAAAGCHPDLKADQKHAAELRCVQCHVNVVGEQAEEHEDALSDFGPEQMCGQSGCHGAVVENVAQGFHSDAPCEQCHGFVHEEFRAFDPNACKGCHKQAVNTLEPSVHGREEVHCGECHGDTHAPLISSKSLLAPMSKVMQPESCVVCHDSKKVRSFRGSIHGRALMVSGLDVAPTCSTCHGAHGMKPVDDPTSPVFHANVPQTCGSCHKFILAAVRESVHAKVEPKDGRNPPVCTNCHQAHGTLRLDIDENRLATPEECRDCHVSQYETYRHSFHGKATKLGLAVAATCSDCHSPHRMLGKDDPKSTIHPNNLRATCEKCHGPVTASFLEFKPHVNPASRGDDSTIYFVWLFMTSLLVGTIGFFSIHTLLWAQRSVVGWIRGELRHEHREEGPWIRRFKPVHIYIHLAIISTFLALAFTGLPIKFSDSAWASPLANFVGGLGGARWLHRVAGVLTFGYAIIFVGYLLREIVVRKRRSLLFGWQSMVPNWKDAQDLGGNLRWFFYLGSRPKLDRWAYWEKFDFFAVFWGIPIIGISGLVLWFPVAVSHIMPGWMINVAYVIHSDEALLATGFIFFFHFFHTHLRPEAFPLDPVIFTGAMPLDRFKEERPTEYERLVAAGELEKYIVPAPTERVQNFATTFGFLALGVGLVLGIALLVTGLQMVAKYIGLQ